MNEMDGIKITETVYKQSGRSSWNPKNKQTNKQTNKQRRVHPRHNPLPPLPQHTYKQYI